MKKNHFLKTTILLIIGGFITKILGMIIKIVLTRTIKAEGMGIYMMIMPTYTLLIALATFGFPVAISKLVAENRYNNKRLVLGIIPVSLLINIILIIIIMSSGHFIANTLLHEPKTYLGIISISFVLPFISLSSILRGYFFGKERMVPHIISNILEDVVRLGIVIFFVPFTLKYGSEVTVAFVILSSIFSELSSIIIFIICLPKKVHLNEFKPIKNNVYSILNISVPTTGSRIIGSIGYFFEPIMFTFILLNSGFQNSFVLKEYGIINGYVLPLLLLPSFFTLAISQALIPIISKSYTQKKYQYTKDKIKQAIYLSLLIGIPITIIFTIFPDIPLNFLYHTNLGENYLRILAPFFIFYYIEAPLISSLQAMGKAKVAMKGTLYGMIIRLIVLSIGTYLFHTFGLILAIISNILFISFYQLKQIKKSLM